MSEQAPARSHKTGRLDQSRPNSLSVKIRRQNSVGSELCDKGVRQIKEEGATQKDQKSRKRKIDA